MIVTIIGSLKMEKSMNACQEYFECLGFTVNNPLKDQKDKLIDCQLNWFRKIKEADLIVVIPKYTEFKTVDDQDKRTILETEFGESTSYEMAIAMELGKKLVVW